MAPAYKELLSDMASRCSITDAGVLRKSKELLSLLESKITWSCPESCKVVVCLELASSLSSRTSFSRDDAIKYSGCKKKGYVNMYHNISKLLNLDKVYSVRDVCLCLGVSEVQLPAQKLLEKYKLNKGDLDADWDHPMFSCAVVWASCRHNKVKVDSRKLVEISRLKRGELDELTKKLESHLKAVSLAAGNTKRQIPVPEDAVVPDAVLEPKRSRSDVQMTDDEFMEWKRKMLED